MISYDQWIPDVRFLFCVQSFLPFDKALRNSILLHFIQKNRRSAKPKTRMFDIRCFGFAFLQFTLRHQSTYVWHTLFTNIHKAAARKLHVTYVVLLTYVFSALQSEVSKFQKRERIKLRSKLTYNSFVDTLMSHIDGKFIKFSFQWYNFQQQICHSAVSTH